LAEDYIKSDLVSYPRPLCGRGKGEGALFAQALSERREHYEVLRDFVVNRISTDRSDRLQLQQRVFGKSLDLLASLGVMRNHKLQADVAGADSDELFQPVAHLSHAAL